MDIKDYIREKRADKVSAEIIKELKKMPDCDDDLILGVLVHLKNDDDKKTFLNYLKDGNDVDYEQCILNALFLSQQRKK